MLFSTLKSNLINLNLSKLFLKINFFKFFFELYVPNILYFFFCIKKFIKLDYTQMISLNNFLKENIVLENIKWKYDKLKR